MRTAAFALACLLGAAATTPAAGEDVPAYNLPPFPSGPPAPEAAAPASNLHAYAPVPARGDTPRPQRGRTCFTQAEAREKIAQLRLTDPVNATHAGRSEGEALRTRLCRWKQNDFVYEVYVLRHDGRVVRLYINAQNGQAVSAADMTDHK